MIAFVPCQNYEYCDCYTCNYRIAQHKVVTKPLKTGLCRNLIVDERWEHKDNDGPKDNSTEAEYLMQLIIKGYSNKQCYGKVDSP